jgi:hypothetical protein
LAACLCSDVLWGGCHPMQGCPPGCAWLLCCCCRGSHQLWLGCTQTCSRRWSVAPSGQREWQQSHNLTPALPGQFVGLAACAALRSGGC